MPSRAIGYSVLHRVMSIAAEDHGGAQFTQPAGSRVRHRHPRRLEVFGGHLLVRRDGMDELRR